MVPGTARLSLTFLTSLCGENLLGVGVISCLSSQLHGEPWQRGILGVLIPGFKWFGSLTNLSQRHPPEKASNKAVPHLNESLCGAGAAEGGQSVDDRDSSPCSYALFAHVASVPLTQKIFRVKEKTAQEEKQEGPSQWKAGEHVRDSPLLGVLSALSLTAMEQPQRVLAQPLPPAPNRPSPLTSAPDSCLRELPVLSHETRSCKAAAGPERDPSDMTSCRAASKQDVYVPMDPISDRTRTRTQTQPHPQTARQPPEQETNKTATTSQEVWSGDRCSKVTDSGGEYVKFCKEKFWLEPPSEKLRKELEEELKLSGTEMKSHAWYHGRIPWEVSETLVLNHGDFLIRDSQSSQGDFVLTCRWEQRTLHFLIRKTVVLSAEKYTQVRYGLEGEAFDSLPALVHYYVGSRAALTQSSRAQIHRPANRMLPIRFLEATFCTAVSPHPHPRGLKSGVEGGERVRPSSPSRLQRKRTEVSGQPEGPCLTKDGESCSFSPNDRLSPSRSPHSSQAADVTPFPNRSWCSDTTRSMSSPSSTLHRKHLNVPHLEQDAPSSDKDGSCYTELYPQSYVERLQAEEGSSSSDPLRTDDVTASFSPVVETVSCFRPSRYLSALMSKENKPLEVNILRSMKELLVEVNPRTAAQHITMTDCLVGRILQVTPEMQRMMGVSSGMELLTLPQGQQLRLDLLERFQTMAIMFAVNLLGCTGTTEARAALLHKIIQMAAELKTTMGNLFGFAAVMKALELPQVSRLEQMWTALRQRHTDGAVLYEKTLRPFLRSLNDGTETCPPCNTTFPHVLPLLTLLEKSLAVGEGTEPWETVEVSVDVVMFHLGAARTMAQLGGLYRSNAESKLRGFQEQAEVREIFLTDFQMRLLWGSRGAQENQALRFSKFDQVLTALSNRLEPPLKRP
ncbi:SH2 domain-containing protein 3C-like [Nematolebias whitei]|uniref:SH2 domain-containing protein 3C-like n=1 Tax=Nematolebias whitei TaxID=451745 RepID=UPI00189BB0ED|nr:SH2 domain-containing protein 3C-like [Nematolebias whitei]